MITVYLCVPHSWIERLVLDGGNDQSRHAHIGTAREFREIGGHPDTLATLVLTLGTKSIWKLRDIFKKFAENPGTNFTEYRVWNDTYFGRIVTFCLYLLVDQYLVHKYSLHTGTVLPYVLSNSDRGFRQRSQGTNAVCVAN